MVDERAAATERLGEVRVAMHERFGDEHGTHSARLDALDSALAAATMHVEHLFDEEVREVELAGRISRREKVHGLDPSHEVISPVGRSIEHTLDIAKRA